jgi:hypothetical protein
LKYRLGLEQGGLMEDPEWHIEFIETVEANSLGEAKDKWAKKTGHFDESYDRDSKTYWGWRIVQVKERE